MEGVRIRIRARVTDMGDGTYRPEVVIEGDSEAGRIQFGMPRKTPEKARKLAVRCAKAGLAFYGSGIKFA